MGGGGGVTGYWPLLRTHVKVGTPLRSSIWQTHPIPTPPHPMPPPSHAPTHHPIPHGWNPLNDHMGQRGHVQLAERVDIALTALLHFAVLK